MKLLHLSDLHIGKRLNEYSLLEDQAHILNEILSLVDHERPDGVLLAGDLYDKPVPSAEAVELFDNFLFGLAERRTQVFVISGNHDSPERIAFGGRLMNGSGVHLAPVYNGVLSPVTLEDAFGKTDIYLLPFLRPSAIRRFFPEEKIETYTDAVRTALSNLPFDPARRNILLTHQFVTGAARSESEEISVGGTDNVDASIFDRFDYVALGHIHTPQSIGRETLRYCGTPLKYSLSESNQQKSVTLIELQQKGSLSVHTLPLQPLRELRQLRGSYMELSSRSFYSRQNTEDYIHITLTDEEDIPFALGRLRLIYPRLIKLDYDNTRTRSSHFVDPAELMSRTSPLELFAGFYKTQNNQPMSAEQLDFVQKIMEEIMEENR